MLSGLGILAFAISGGLAAREHDMDAIGIVALAVITATGGGITRDLLIGAQPVAALVDLWMIALAVLSGLIVLLFVGAQERLRRPLLIFDAIGLGLFVVDGTMKGLSFGLHPGAAVVVGVITGVGGGALRDVLSGEVPIIFRRRSQLYVVPAVAGATMVVLLQLLGWATPLSLMGTAVVILAVRIAAIRFDWHLPGARFGSPG